MDPPLLQARDLAFAFGRQTVLVGVDLDVAPGSCSVIRGDNGTGKSTLLQLLQGRLRPSRGWVRLAGRPLQGQRRRVALQATLTGGGVALLFLFLGASIFAALGIAAGDAARRVWPGRARA